MIVPEVNLEEFVYEIINKGQSDSRGLLIGDEFDHVERQLSLGGYGIPDIVTFKRSMCPAGGAGSLEINIIELKKGDIDISHASQVMRYAHGMFEYAVNYLDLTANHKFIVNPILIGSGINMRSDYFLFCECKNLTVYNYRFSAENGICFNCEFDSDISTEQSWMNRKIAKSIKNKLMM